MASFRPLDMSVSETNSGQNKSIVDMYDQTSRKVELPELGEMLFFSGNPDADIVVVSEAPTWSDGNDETFFSTTLDRYRNANWGPDQLEEYWREYPFTDELTQFGFPGETRHRLYRQYVDSLLSFLDSPRESIAFTDVVKRPLEDSQDLEDVLDNQYDYTKTLKMQISYVEPSVVICNKVNVSEKLPELFGLESLSEREPIPTRLPVSIGDAKFYFVFSAMAHMYMDNFSKRRLVREVKWAYEQEP